MSTSNDGQAAGSAAAGMTSLGCVASEEDALRYVRALMRSTDALLGVDEEDPFHRACEESLIAALIGYACREVPAKERTVHKLRYLASLGHEEGGLVDANGLDALFKLLEERATAPWYAIAYRDYRTCAPETRSAVLTSVQARLAVAAGA